MSPRWLLFLAACFAGDQAQAMGIEDDPLLLWILVDQLEWRQDGEEQGLAWEAQGWLGRDLNKLWFKTEGETDKDKTEEAELQFLYSRAIAPYWDLQAGWRHELRPEPDRDWAVLALQGLAPYHFEIDASLFVGTSGRTAARLSAEYELLFSQRLILTPELEINLHGKDDPERRVGAGLSDLEVGLRLRYEIRREFAPYVGIHWEQVYGQTADYAQEDGRDSSGFAWVVGLRAWF